MKRHLGFGILLAAVVLCSACSASLSIPTGAPQGAIGSADRSDTHDEVASDDDAGTNPDGDVKPDVPAPSVRETTHELSPETPGPTVAMAETGGGSSSSSSSSVSASSNHPTFGSTADPAIIYDPDQDQVAYRQNHGDLNPAEVHDEAFRASSGVQAVNPQQLSQ